MADYWLVNIEGNIGSGKSTFAEAVKGWNMPNVTVLQEPVDEWDTIADKSGETILQKFYKDSAKYAFPFQMMAYISRLVLLKRAIESAPPGQIIISERSLQTDHDVFARMLYDDGKIGEVEFQIYMRWYSEFTKQIKVAQTLYIRADPDVCMERIRTRGRPGEEGISAAYLETCHKYHDDMIWGIAGAHTVNANGMASQEDYRLWFGAVTANAPKPPKSAAVTLWFDGGSRGNGTNRTVAGSGALLETHPANGAEHLANCTCHLGNATNNEAEYVGLIIGLQCAVEELGATTVHVRGDSKLVIEQMSGNWAVKAPNLTPLHAAACRLAAGFKEVTYTHVPRNQNKRADKLSNDAMDDTSAARSVDSFYAVGKPQRVSDL